MYYSEKLTKIQEANIKGFIKELSEEIYEFAKKKYPGLQDELKVICKNYPDSRSIGGLTQFSNKAFISISYLYYLRSDPTARYPYDLDPDIGYTKSKSYKKRLASLICHEIAHAVQFQIVFSDHFVKIPKTTKYYRNLEYQNQENHKYYKPGEVNGSYDLETMIGHGALWQSIYRTLRKEFVNGKRFNDKNLGLQNVRTRAKNKAKDPVSR